MNSKRITYFGLLAFFLALACVFRMPRLDCRPMHGDEANQAVRTGMLMDGQGYRFDPTDHHGPTLYYAALPFCRATAESFRQTDERNFRAVPVAFSLLTLVALALLPLKGARIPAMALLALSPAFCFYSRFFIQETLLVCFLYGMFLSAWFWTGTFGELQKHRSRRRLLCALAFGAFAGLSVCTKETVVLSFAAAAAAGLCALLAPCSGAPRIRVCDILKSAIPAVFAAAVVFVALYSSFFTNFSGVYDALFNTASAYVGKAFVSDHSHPWYAYFNWIGWFRYGRGPVIGEALILPFAAVSAAVSFVKLRRGGIFIALYTVLLAAIYSAIPYKTPWCALSFLFGAILMAADGVALLWRMSSRALRTGLVAVFAALLLWHGWQAFTVCFRYPADVRNPYVYAHTGNDCLLLVDRIQRFVAGSKEGTETLIAIAAPASDYWPLPWYLRNCQNVGCWNRVADIPAELKPSVLVSAAGDGEAASAMMGADAEEGFYGVRPGVLVQLFTARKEK